MNLHNGHRKKESFPTHETLNNVLAIDKQTVSFKGYTLGKIHKQRLCLTNKANGLRRMHIIPPQGGMFKIRYKKKGNLMPGFTVKIIVEFCSDQYQHYEDFIRIHCEGCQNIVIPLYAFPVLDLSHIPSEIHFPETPICKQIYHVLSLKSGIPVDFSFVVHYEGHPSISVSPTSGLVPGYGSSDIKVVFCPTEYVTARATFRVTITSQHDQPTHTCTVFGVSKPGLERDMIVEEAGGSEALKSAEVRKYFTSTSIEDIINKTVRSTLPTKKKKPKKELVVDGVRFPDNLNTHTSVASVLNQKPGQLKASELRSMERSVDIARKIGNERQLKCAVFESVIKQKALEERNNKLRWMTNLGVDPMTPEQSDEIRRERERANTEYSRLKLDLPELEEFGNIKTRCISRRIYRWFDNHTHILPTFDPYRSSEWGKRKLALTKFIQAARKVILQSRVAKRFKMIRQASRDTEGDTPHSHTFIPDNLGELYPNYLPLYHRPEHDFHLSPLSLASQSVSRMNLEMVPRNPVFDLKVPVFCELLNYKEHEVQYSEMAEVPLPENRSGAEDEVTVIVEAEELLAEDVYPSPDAAPGAVQYPPLMVFNPAPNIQVKCPPVAYLETSEGFKLDPLIRLPLENKDPLVPLNKSDVIPGSQQWHRYPSQFLVSTTTAETISRVWCQRRESALSFDLVEEIPLPLPGPCKDIEVIEGEDDMDVIWPSASTAVSQFKLDDIPVQPEESIIGMYEEWFGINPPYYTHGANGPILRKEAQDMQDTKALEEQNMLHRSIHRKLNHLQRVISNPKIRFESEEEQGDMMTEAEEDNDEEEGLVGDEEEGDRLPTPPSNPPSIV